MIKKTNWAILGPGKIADKFASAFPLVHQANLMAVASRDKKRGDDFAHKYAIPKVYYSYKELLVDSEIDIVYISTPHVFHYEQALLCIKHKKAVLCEKPLTMNARQTLELISASKANNTFLMEGMWTRFFPATHKMMELITAGKIGEAKLVRADFGFAAPHLPDHRVRNLKLGGGAQLDVGVYPLFLALLLCGKPTVIQAVSKLAEAGADETTAAQLYFENDTIANILSSIVIDTSKQAEITGTTGKIILHAPWHKSQKVTFKKNSGEEEVFDFSFEGAGFQYELQHVTDCMLRGFKESNLMPLELSLRMAQVADEIIRQAGVIYPNSN